MDDETRRIVDSGMLGEAIESLSVAVFVSDSALNYLAVNAAAARLVGLTRGELLERRVPDVVARPYRALADASLEVEQHGPRFGVSSIRRADGGVLDVAYVTLAARIGQLPVLVSFVLSRAALRPDFPQALQGLLAAG